MEIMSNMVADQTTKIIDVATTIGGIVVVAAVIAVDVWITVLIIKALTKYIKGK